MRLIITTLLATCLSTALTALKINNIDYNSGRFRDFSRCNAGPFNSNSHKFDQVVNVPWDQFEQVTNLKIKLAKINFYKRQITIVGNQETTFQGFFVTINSTNVYNANTRGNAYSKKALSPTTLNHQNQNKLNAIGKLLPKGAKVKNNANNKSGYSTYNNKLMKQVKCQKTTDTIRHRGNEKNNFEYADIIWSSSIHDCDSVASGVKIKFQIFVAKELSGKNQGRDNVWYYTELGCNKANTGDVQETSLNSNSIEEDLGFSLPKVQLKFAGMGDDDVQLKAANMYRKPIVKTERGNYFGSLTQLNGHGNNFVNSPVNPHSHYANSKSHNFPHAVDLSKSIIAIETYDWNNWSNWTECSKSCGFGEMYRSRKCISSRDNKVVTDAKCYGQSKHVTQCIKTKCSAWATWQPWSSCSVTCGEGVKTRKRVCLYGDDCIGNPNESEKCQTKECPSEKEDTKDSQENQGTDSSSQKNTDEDNTEKQNNSDNDSSSSNSLSVASNNNAKCENKYSFCEHWHKKGYCEKKFTKWMHINCPVVCKKCEQPKKLNCVDRYPISCPRWKAQNRCNHPDKFLREYIVRNCKLSCQQC